ncbi:MAG: cob(I)yrinic acid a,c-diamide adenosyltransferase [Desulfovibrio sp.]|nr:cob(I)yrinic acid a,c-diamide adenosyltransferase [Desulfovibrio sp.]
MIVVYAGTGKGKTSACLGQMLRALGHGKTVAFAQFIKRDGCAGEQVLLRSLLGSHFNVQGLGFVKNCADKAPHIEAARNLLTWSMAILPSVWLLILDEVLYALDYGLVSKSQLSELLVLARKSATHLVLSGRKAPDWLIEASDLVSLLSSVKHPHALGQKALLGLEY